nr:MAG TPA: hypothetical protein [Caudoviricetes sp.]DAP40611.1 MAG TPA: hypothetical protein [Caudoviricetes sp.]
MYITYHTYDITFRNTCQLYVRIFRYLFEIFIF